MGRIKEITVGMRRLYRHPFIDFENWTIEGALTIEVEEGEDPLEVAEKSFPALRKQMLAQYKEFKPKRKST